MPFVKLDTGLLDSSLWIDRDAREIFITSLLMADPWGLTEETPQLHVRTLKETGYTVPAGWYGMVHAAGSGIVHRARLELEPGLAALERLSAPDADSRSPEHEGRRIARIDGGYLVLNYWKYREYDHGAAERMRVLRAKRRAEGGDVRPNNRTVRRTVTEGEGRGREGDIPQEGSEPGAVTDSGAVAPTTPPPSNKSPGAPPRPRQDKRHFDEIKQIVRELWKVFPGRSAEELHKLGGKGKRVTVNQIRAAYQQLRDDGELA